MPPVGAAIGAAVTGIGASISTALTGAAFSGFAVKAFTQIAIGVAFSAVSRMLMPGQKLVTQGVRTSVGFGEDAPSTIILGRTATAGDLVYANSHGDDNEYYVLVLELSDLPARLRRVMVNGAWVTLSATDGKRGRSVVEYRRKGEDHLWVKFFDGSQTAASATLRDHYGDDPDRPWGADMVGRGIAYAVVTARFSPEVHRGVPELLFELDGARLYDPRRDSSVGGSGSQRWSNAASWCGFGDPACDNPVVQIYNIMLGLRDPLTAEHLWGGTDILQRDLPLASWFAAMNACDALMPAGDSGLEESQYRAGIEIALEDETEPADAIDELLKACQGQIAEAAGAWVVRAGPLGAAVFAFSDDDVIVTSPEELDPFPGLDQVWNGVSARYPEPEDGWAEREAPIRLNAGYRAEDGGRLRIAPLQFPTVPYRAQVQRLMASALKDGRRFRRHSVVLPPEARALGPLDVVEWTSARHGYDAKQFSVDLLEDLPSGCVALALREIDPSDYDFAAGDLLPTTVGFLGRPPRLPQPLDFGAEGVSLPDAAGTARRPGIKLDWDPLRKASGVRYQLQLLDRPDDLPLLGGHDTSDDDLSPSPLEVFAGEPLEVRAGEPLVEAYLSDILAGTTIITAGVLPAAAYRIRARYVPNGGWCPWIEVETPDTRVSALDLDAALNSRIDDAQSKADAAASDAANAVASANAAKGIAEALAGDTIADLEALLAAFAGVDAGDIIENRLLTLRALQSGWNADPTFQLWASASPEKWTATGLSGNGGPFAGFYGGGLALDIPSGAIAVTLTAASNVAGEMPAADADAPWLVLYALVTFTSGNADALRLRAEWLPEASSTWVAGDMKGLTAPVGNFTQLGIGAKPGIMQGVELLVQRPAGLAANADGVRFVVQKTSTVTTAVDCDVHLLGLRKASDAEIAAGQAAGALAAAVSTLSTTITGVSDALAALQTSLSATAPSGVTALLASTYLTAVQVNSALSGLQATLNAAIAGFSSNLTTNYYVKAQVDSGIASAVGAASTALNGRIDTAEAAIEDEAGFRVAGDSALAGRVATIEARSDPGSIISNGSFATGSFAGWGGLHANVTVVPRGGSNSAQQTAPSPYMLKIAAEPSTSRAINNETREAKQGDIVSASALYAAGGTTRDVTLRFIVRFLDAAGAILSSPFTEVLNTTGTAWARVQTPGYPAPANTASVVLYVQRVAGGSGDAYVTGIEGRKGDAAALARISTVEAVAASASGAITSLSTSINASFGSQSAFISEMQGAVATLDSATAFWGFRQKAGAAVGTAEAVAFTDATGTSIATFSLDYDLINFEARVSARDLVIPDSTNLVPDDQLQTPEIWIDSAEWTVALITNQAVFRSLGEVRWSGPGVVGVGNAISTGSLFAVVPGDKLACSFQAKCQDGTFRAYAQVQFFDRNGAQVSIFTFSILYTSSTGIFTTAPAVTTVPTGAVKAVWRWVVDRTNTTSTMVRFAAPTVRRQSQTVEIADGAITAEKANFSDLGAVVATLGSCTITSALNFADGVVVTGAVALNAISDIAAANRTSILTLTNEDTWYDVASLAVTVADGATVLVTGLATVDRASEWNTSYASNYDVNGNLTYRVIRGATQLALGQQSEFIDDDPGPGTHTYKIQAMSLKPPGGNIYNFTAGTTTPYTVTTKIETARIASGRLIIKQFKR